MSKLRLRIYDGTRQLFAAPAKFLVTITDGNLTQRVRDFFPTNDTPFDVPFFDNFGDNYTVDVYADGHREAGYTPVKLSDSYVATLDIMLVSNDPGFSFVNARSTQPPSSIPSSPREPVTLTVKRATTPSPSRRALACPLTSPKR